MYNLHSWEFTGTFHDATLSCQMFILPAAFFPIGSMYAIFTYIYHRFKPNVFIYIYTFGVAPSQEMKVYKDPLLEM